MVGENPHPLEPDAPQMREIGRAALDALVAFVEGLPDAPAADREGAGELARRFRGAAPEEGRPFPEVLAEVVEASSKAIETAGPGYLAYIPGGGLFTSSVAALLSFGVNRVVGLAEFAPVLAQIEATTIRWMCDLFDFPPESGGILTSGGSLANLSAIVTARRALLPDDFLAGTLYASEHTHHSVVKSAVIAGFPARNVRVVPCTSDLRMDVAALHRMIDEDRAAGSTPFCVVANGGTTNTGTVDPLPEIVAVAHERRMWVHVDAAYGGFFQLTDRGRRALRGITGADSITLDPHKGLFLPYGTGALIVRDGAALRRAHHAEAHYLQDLAPEGEIPDLTHQSPELSRDFRGLRMWLPVVVHGLGAFRAALDEKLDLTRYVYEELVATPGIEVPWEPDLSIVGFRHRTGGPADAGEGVNRALLRRINASGRVFLSSTRIAGRFTLRVCILSHRTHVDRIEECVSIIRAAVREAS